MSDKQWTVAQGVNLKTSLYTAIFEIQTPGGILEMTMSPQLLKAMHMIMSRHIMDYEERNGAIAVDRELAHKLGLEEEL